MARCSKVILLITPPSYTAADTGKIPEIGARPRRARNATCGRLARLFGVPAAAVAAALGGVA